MIASRYMFSTPVNHLKQSNDMYSEIVTRKFKMAPKMAPKMAAGLK